MASYYLSRVVSNPRVKRHVLALVSHAESPVGCARKGQFELDIHVANIPLQILKQLSFTARRNPVLCSVYTHEFSIALFKATINNNSVSILAHLSRRLTRWAYSIPMVRRPSVVVRRRPQFQTWISLKLAGQSWSNFLCVALLGLGKGCIKFWDRLDQNSDFHCNRNPSLTYNGKNDVSTFSRLFFIGSFFY